MRKLHHASLYLLRHVGIENELISLSHDRAPRVTEQSCAVCNCRFKADFPLLSKSREEEEGNESTDRGGPDVFKHDAPAAAAQQ